MDIKVGFIQSGIFNELKPITVLIPELLEISSDIFQTYKFTFFAHFNFMQIEIDTCLLCVQPLTGLTNLSMFYLQILLHRNHVRFIGMCNELAFPYLISCAKVWSRHCFGKILFGQLTSS